MRSDASFAFMGVSVVTTTVAHADDARKLAHGAVQQRLAACAQVDVIQSHYMWQGQLHEEAEWRLSLKTVPDAVQPLLQWLRAEHPYELPQLLMRSEQAQRDYAQWVAQQVDVPDVHRYRV